jgi:hypothetical protein
MIEKLSQFEDISTRMRRGENVQKSRLKNWLSADESERIVAEWDGNPPINNLG